jgi:hypothetical protein
MTMFRPAIKGALETQVHEYMEIAGFDDPSEFTRYCLRKELEHLRQQRIAMERQ